MKTINRKDLIKIEEFRPIFENEVNHDHEVILDDHGVYRWKSLPDETGIVTSVSRSHLFGLIDGMGIPKNHDNIKRLFRGSGMSLIEYRQMFYGQRISD